MRAIGYIRLSKADRARKGETEADVAARQKASLVAQREAIERACNREDWDLVHIYEDNGRTGANTRREGFQAALAAVRPGDMFVIAKLDRLTRDVADFGDLLKRADRKGRCWYIAVLDEKIDTSTAAGWLSAMMLAVVAEYERRVISERTRDALDVIGRTKQLGRPSTIQEDVARRVKKLHAEGKSSTAIARQLTADGVPTERGGTWHHSVIGAFLRREGLLPEASAA
jgi:DNA invertase Pin-like site-specific DNA recombinase